MMRYRFRVLLAACVTCLSFAPSYSRHPGLELTLSGSPVSLFGSWELAQALPADTTEKPLLRSESSAYDRYMKEGYKATEQRDYQTALQKFKEALAQNPNDSYAQKAIPNVEKYLESDAEQATNQRPSLFWVLLGLVAIAVGVGGGLFFLLWVLRQYAPEAEPEYLLYEEDVHQLDFSEKASSDAHPSSLKQKKDNYSPKVSKDSLGEADLNTDEIPDKSLPIQQTTRLSNLDLIEELIKDLREPNPKRRRKAIWELAQRADSRAVKPLVELMIDSDSQERGLILEALSQISTRTLKPINQALAISLQDENAQVRKNAIRDLTKIYNLMSQISRLLCHATDDRDPEVRETAQWALDQLNLIQMPLQVERLSMRENPSNLSDNSLQ